MDGIWRRSGFRAHQSGVAASVGRGDGEAERDLAHHSAAHRFAEVDKAFGQWENSGINTILYGIDNEIHHRGQGYVYLRALGIDPPPFWER